MVKKQEKFPQIGELVVAQVESIEKMYIYVKLEDYEGNQEDSGNARGMVHISELANRWIRNVSNFVRVNQRVVLKVLRVNEDKGHIDLSLRRVNAEQQGSKMNEWKYEKKAENLFKVFAENQKLTMDEVYDKIGFPLIDKFGALHYAFDAIKENGTSELDNIDLSEDLKNELFQLIDSNVQLHQVDIEGLFEIIVYEGNGIEFIKNAIKKAKEIKMGKNSSVTFHYIGAPSYRIKIIAGDYLEAEKKLKEIQNVLEAEIKKVNGSIEFNRID